LSLSLHLRLYSHHSPSPYPTLHYYNQTKHPPCPISQLQIAWLGLPPSIIMGARRRNQRLARCSAESVCLRAHRYLHYAPLKPHTQPRTLTTPLHTTTLHSHLLPTHTPAPHSHLSFGHKLPVTARTPGLVPTIAKHRATLHIHSTHSINTCKHATPTRLGQVYTRALGVPPSSPQQRVFVCGACIGNAQVGISLVSLFDPLFKRSRLHCVDVCLTRYL